MLSAPSRPAHLSPLAERCLRALAERGLGRRVSVGGAVGLLHFHDYRSTLDLDAWWQRDATGVERLEVEATLRGVLASEGEVGIRRWGAEKRRAEAVRRWLAKDFLDALVD